MLKVKNLTLLLIAGGVWFVAGANIARIGIEAYIQDSVTFLNIILSFTIGVLFWFMAFYKLTVKHTRRITGYANERQPLMKFFDTRSFIIMIVMMSGGILIRAFHLLPSQFIAVFYTGLGCALALAGLLFVCNYIRARRGACIL